MLIIVPPSETKRPPAASGVPVALDDLSFPELTPTRRRLVEALMATSAAPDAFRRLFVRPSIAPEVARNTWLTELPAMPVLDLYTGPLHEGLDAEHLSDEAARRAQGSVVVASALWGALRPMDRIPPYRMHICSRLLGIDRLEPVWREVLPEALADAAGTSGLVVDLRSGSYQAAGMPRGLGDRTVTLKVALGRGANRIGDVVAKRLRGEAARELLESGAQPGDPEALADVLAERWPVRLEAPVRRDGGWTMTIAPDR